MLKCLVEKEVTACINARRIWKKAHSGTVPGFVLCCGTSDTGVGSDAEYESGLGVAAIISVSYCVSIVSGYNFGDTTFVMYVIFVATQIILHMVRECRYRKKAAAALVYAGSRNWKLVCGRVIAVFNHLTELTGVND